MRSVERISEQEKFPTNTGIELENYYLERAQGYPEAATYPPAIKAYERGLANSEVSQHRLNYSLEFLECSDFLAKYKFTMTNGKMFDDDYVDEILQAFVAVSKEDFYLYLEADGFDENQQIELVERLQTLAELNGEREELISKIDNSTNKLVELFASCTDEELTRADFTKAAFAIEKISEKSKFDSDFNFIEKVKTYFEYFLGIRFEDISEEERLEFLKLITGLSKNPISNMIATCSHPMFGTYNVASIKCIEDPSKWYGLYKKAIDFLITSFSYRENEGLSKAEVYQKVLETFHDCEALLPQSYHQISETSSFDSLQKRCPSLLPFNGFGDQLVSHIRDNAKCRSEKEWLNFTLANFILEATGKSSQVEKSYNTPELQTYNAELQQKFLDASNQHNEFIAYETEEDSHNIILSKLNIDGEIIPICIKFAKVKSAESVLRKALIKGTSINDVRDIFRAMVIVDKKGVLSDEEKRKKICIAFISTLHGIIGTEFIEDSIKNTFNSGAASSFSAGGLECMKFAMKFEVGDKTCHAEFMVLENYPDNHKQYEAKMYSIMKEVFALCSYQRMIEELTEELSRKAVLGLNDSDLILFEPILHYVSRLEDDIELNPNFIRNLNYLLTRLGEVREINPKLVSMKTKIEILRSLAHS